MEKLATSTLSHGSQLSCAVCLAIGFFPSLVFSRWLRSRTESLWVEKCIWLPWWWILKPQHCDGRLKFHASLWESKICVLPWQGRLGYEPVASAHKILIKGKGCDVVHERSVVMSAFSCSASNAKQLWGLPGVYAHQCRMHGSTFHPLVRLSDLPQCVLPPSFLRSLRPDFKSVLLELLIFYKLFFGVIPQHHATYKRPG